MTYKNMNRMDGQKKQPSREFGYSKKADGRNTGDENVFRFKNSLIITPFYEIEFNATGGIKYLRNHANTVFIVGDHIYARTNNIQKIPVLLKREINKQSDQKKLIIEEKYNYEEKYSINQNIILFFDENRLDFQILFNKNKSSKENKDITDEFSLAFFLPEVDNKILLPEDCSGNRLLYSGANEYLTIKSNKVINQRFKNKTLFLYNDNIVDQQKIYMNYQLYLFNKA